MIKPETKRAQIARLLEAGKSVREIASIIGSTRGAVNTARHAMRTGYIRPSYIAKRAERAKQKTEWFAECAKTPEFIPLTRGLKAQIDPEDFHFLMQWNWCAHEDSSGKTYAISSGNLKMHRLIVGAQPGQLVDHRNGDGLDNQRFNLRIATQSQNMWNKRPTGRSSFKGIYFYRATGQWTGQVTGADGKRRSIGYHDNETDAAKARDAIALELHGEFAWLNFPDARAYQPRMAAQ